MMKTLRLAALALAAAFGLGLVAPVAAHAGKTGRRNTALLLGAVAAYGVIKRKPAIAGIAGAGALYSFTRSSQSDKKRRRGKRRGRRYAGRSSGYCPPPRYSSYHAPKRYYSSYRPYRSSYSRYPGYHKSAYYSRPTYHKKYYKTSYKHHKHSKHCGHYDDHDD